MPANFIEISSIVLIFILIINLILFVTWNAFYFKFGIPIFTKKIEISDTVKASKRIQEFINTMDKKMNFSKLTGKMISEDLFFFRRKIFVFTRSNSDFLIGNISVDSENRCVIIKGYFSLSFIIFFIYMLVYAGIIMNFNFKEIIPVILFIFLIVFLCYVVYRKKYKKIADEIEYIINRWY